MSWKELLANAVYPRGIKCIACDGELSENTFYGLCPKCTLPYNTQFCIKCGAPVLEQNTVCDRCKQTEFPFESARSSFIYRDAAATLVHRLKFREARYLAPIMAEFMTDTYYKTDGCVDLVTFVPMHKHNRRMRGYNQAQLLANEVGKRIDAPVAGALVKTAKTASLVGLSQKERQQIVAGAFVADSGVSVADKTVLLVDDVLTTGATASECSRVLLRAGAKKVYVLTFASVENKPPLDSLQEGNNGKRNKMRAKRL